MHEDKDFDILIVFRHKEFSQMFGSSEERVSKFIIYMNLTFVKEIKKILSRIESCMVINSLKVYSK
jgi:uncharacterized protein with ACT and thioredoxin-like domain